MKRRRLSRRQNPNTHALLDQWEHESVNAIHLRVCDCEALMYASSVAIQTKDRHLKTRIRRLLASRRRTAPHQCALMLLPLADLIGGFSVVRTEEVLLIEPDARTWTMPEASA